MSGWPVRVKTMQQNWIGRSLGAEITFPLVRKDIHPDGEKACVKVFTTRPETLPAVQFLAISPSHHVVTAASENIDTSLDSYLEKMPSLPRDSKEGYKLYAGYNVEHPLDPRRIDSIKRLEGSRVLDGASENAGGTPAQLSLETLDHLGDSSGETLFAEQ